jgi:hypothetical protein
MDAVTYPDEKVAGFVNGRLIPLRVLFDHEPLAREFNLKWTPTLITLDADGKEHHRSVGFLGPEEVITSLLLGIGKSCFETGRFEAAISIFDEIIGGHSFRLIASTPHRGADGSEASSVPISSPRVPRDRPHERTPEVPTA